MLKLVDKLFLGNSSAKLCGFKSHCLQYTIYNIEYTIYNIEYTIYNIEYKNRIVENRKNRK